MISKCVIFVLQDEDHLNRLPSHLMNTGDRLATFMFYVSIITMTSWWARWRLKSPASPCLLNCWFRCSSKKTSKLRVSGLCAGNSPVTGEFPAQWASNPENVSIWWRHHVEQLCAVIEKKSCFGQSIICVLVWSMSLTVYSVLFHVMLVHMYSALVRFFERTSGLMDRTTGS